MRSPHRRCATVSTAVAALVLVLAIADATVRGRVSVGTACVAAIALNALAQLR